VDDITGLSFEEAFVRLEETLEEMRRDGLSLDRSLALYEQGTRLAAHCDRLLAQAELRVTELTPTPDDVMTHVVRETLVESEW
jgi:exodeoxyribonuclease VII small subunit